MLPEFQARRDIVEIGRRLWLRGYVAANDGNISARLATDRLLVTPSGLSKGFLRPEELVVVDLEGRKMEGRLEPTSELGMHLLVYRARPDVGGVVHAHPPRATGFAVAGVPLAQCTLPEVILTLGTVPLAPYATPSTAEVARSVGRYIATHSALVLRNHGVLTVGSEVGEAYFRMETVEHLADISLTARALGGENPLTSEEVRKLLAVRERLGLVAAAGACERCGACRDGAAAGEAGRLVEAAGGRGGVAPPDAEAADDEDIVRAVVEEVQRALSGS